MTNCVDTVCRLSFSGRIPILGVLALSILVSCSPDIDHDTETARAEARYRNSPNLSDVLDAVRRDSRELLAESHSPDRMTIPDDGFTFSHHDGCRPANVEEVMTFPTFPGASDAEFPVECTVNLSIHGAESASIHDVSCSNRAFEPHTRSAFESMTWVITPHHSSCKPQQTYPITYDLAQP